MQWNRLGPGLHPASRGPFLPLWSSPPPLGLTSSGRAPLPSGLGMGRAKLAKPDTRQVLSSQKDGTQMVLSQRGCRQDTDEDIDDELIVTIWEEEIGPFCQPVAGGL